MALVPSFNCQPPVKVALETANCMLRAWVCNLSLMAAGEKVSSRTLRNLRVDCAHLNLEVLILKKMLSLLL